VQVKLEEHKEEQAKPEEERMDFEPFEPAEAR